MVLNVEIISKEMVKPSSPTPHHLKHHKLSFLDQFQPPVYIPFIFFYSYDQLGYDGRVQKHQALKQSLSDTLTLFYPLAGRVKGNVVVDCNDNGVEYVEAQVRAQLSQVIENPNPEELEQYLSVEPWILIVSEILLSIQITFFDCGGMAIGVCMSHKLGDGLSLVSFINSWAAKSRGDHSKILGPIFDAALHFPPRDSLEYTPTAAITKQDKIVTRRFVFDKSKIAALKEAASSSQVKNPSRVEVVSAFIWRHFMEVVTQSQAKLKVDTQKIFLLIHMVNLRPKPSPPLPDHAFGNICWFTPPMLKLESPKDHHDLVSQLRGKIREINSDYVKKIQTGEEYLKLLNRSNENQSTTVDTETFIFSSRCGFPLYEVDYGWGKPVWVCPPASPTKNRVTLMSTRSGDGIEAWVTMLEEDMVMFENNHEILSLVPTLSVPQNPIVD
ncbi:unnamed protein product [Ilex paraguariensis]|uniref:Vinorine synthase n=1 Tax=Ilex paraguariensis TaxID=185542 RepID=A0ABC8TUM9_9AQUA